MINFSFVIPHHNCPALLNRCIASIPQRDDIEVIVVDDKSDIDKLPQIDRQDVKVYFIGNIESRGAGHARNIGITHATGRWLLFADADDFYADNMIDSLDKIVDSDYDIVFWGVHYNYIVETGLEDDSIYNSAIKKYLVDKSPKSLTHLKHLKNEPWNKMVRKEYVDKINARFHEVPVCNDAWFSHYVAANTNKIYAITEKLYYWVKNSNSMTNKRVSYSIERQREEESLKVHILKIQSGADVTFRSVFIGLHAIVQQLGLIIAIRILFMKIKSFLIIICYKLKSLFNKG